MMTPAELKQWRVSHSYTQNALAKEMGVALRSYTRWEWGHYPVPLWAEKFLRLLEGR